MLGWTVLVLILPLTAGGAAKTESKAAGTAKGRAEMKRACARCHPLRVIRAQKLSRDGWRDELRKMEHMGAALGNRDALLDYLSAAYGEVRRK